MVDVIFRDIDTDTLQRLLGVLQDTSYELVDDTEPAWTAEVAEKILRRSTSRAARVTRALVDAGGEITAATAREVAGIAPHHAVASLTASWKKLARHPDIHNVHDPIPDRQPVEALFERNQGRENASGLAGYRMAPAAIGAFTEALARTGD